MGMSDYVRALRAKVGHDLLFMPSVASLIHDDEGRLLLVRHVEGRWQLPGGGVEPGERPAEAARRECAEEAGITIEPMRIFGVYGGPEQRITYANGDDAAWVITVFEARLVAGRPAPSDDETIDVGWFSPDELDQLEFAPSTRSVLDSILAGRPFEA
jgi:8-oxo-dGTP pyrophosphatase MutT (NUDIX family)